MVKASETKVAEVAKANAAEAARAAVVAAEEGSHRHRPPARWRPGGEAGGEGDACRLKVR